MIEYATVARPYAKAVFELAQEKEQFDLWLGGLEQLAWLVQQPKVASLIGSVDLNDSEKALQLVKLLDGCEAVKNAEFKNFINVVAVEKRLAVLPEIFEQYKTLVLARNNTKQAIVYTAYDVKSEGQRAKIISDLEQHFHVGLQATFVTEPELIGGVKVVVGDKILDLSIQGKLQNLYTTLTN